MKKLTEEWINKAEKDHLTHSATSPNAQALGNQSRPAEGGKRRGAKGLSLSVSTLRTPNIENKPRCLPSGYSDGLTVNQLLKAKTPILESICFHSQQCIENI
ncbi:MAG: hypothetical protein FJZ16_08155 [Candidatus Omnitrophica bacterium]|nr:hypothetical protein [Candidatus Omnitrophota bacterium]